MSGEPAPPRRRSLWLLPAAVALLLVPSGLAAATICGLIALRVASALLHRAARRRAATPTLGEAGTLIGADGRGAPAWVTDRQLAAHGLILGASGAGKTTTLTRIITDRIRRGLPVIAIDIKGSPAFARAIGAAAAEAGRACRVWTPDGPSYWNPLEHGNATELKDKLITTERFTEPHYQRAAERYLQLLIGTLRELHPDRPPTLEEVVGGLDPASLARLTRELPIGRGEHVREYLTTLTRDQLSGIRGLGTRLAIISESHTGRFLGPAPPGADRIDVRAALAGEQVALFSLAAGSYGKLAAQLGTLIVQDIVTATGHRLAALRAGAPPGPQALVVLDEFSALGSDNVLALFAQARESRVGVIVATQELADLDRAAPGLRDQILGNTAVKIAHRQDVPGSAQTIAQMAGTVKRWEETHAIGGGLFGPVGRSRGTRRLVENFLVHPNEIKTLRTGEAVVLWKTPRADVRTIHVVPPPRAGREL